MTLSALIAVLLLLVIGVLAPVITHLGGRGRDAGLGKPLGIDVYLMILASLITAWPVLGAIDAAARGDEAILGIFAAPVIALLLLRPMARRLQITARQHAAFSLPTLISARYGRSRSVAIICALTAAAALGILLIAEFKTIAEAAAVIFGMPNNTISAAALPPLIACGALILLPGRLTDANGLNIGLIALARRATIFATIAFGVVISIAVYQVLRHDPLTQAPLDPFGPIDTILARPLITPRFLTIVVVATLAVYVLPGRFTLASAGRLANTKRRQASVLLPVVMLTLVAGIVVIATVGRSRIDAPNSDAAHLALALTHSIAPHWLIGIVFAGFVAVAVATACVCTAAVAAGLVGETLTPALARRYVRGTPSKRQSTLRTLEKSIGLLFLAAVWIGLAATRPQTDLTDLGLVGLTGLALLAVPLIGGLYIRSIKSQGVIAGLAAGVSVWIYSLVIPAFSQAGGLMTAHVPGQSVLGWGSILGLPLSDVLTSGMIWTLITEIGVMAAVSVNTRASLIERTQADAFADPGRSRRRDRHLASEHEPTIRVGEIDTLLRRFLGDQVARETIREYAADRDVSSLAPQVADAELVRFAEDRLASVVGASSARWLLRSGSSRADMDFNDIARVLDRTADAVQFNRGVLRAALENSDQGISVIDSDLRLVTWNSRYLALFNYPPALVRTGRHIGELIRYNAERGECGPGEVEDLVQRRLQHLQRAKPHRFERHRQDGRVLYMTGNPIPGGGFVTSFNDITEFKDKQAELARTNAQLEARVAERTSALSCSNDQLQRENIERARAEQAAETARGTAERADQSKTRFLAAASHDLLQPLNAARLFADAIGHSPDRATPNAIEQIQTALGSAQSLLEPLLDISKLDAGRWPVSRSATAIRDILDPLADQFRVIADDAGLRLDYIPSNAVVDTDPNLLRRTVQNLLSNAVRYTKTGRIVLGVRRRPGAIEIQILDTGPGISDAQKNQIFEEFARGDEPDGTADRGLGLGLSLADRLCQLLGHTIRVDSVPGRGTLFAVHVITTTDSLDSDSASASNKPINEIPIDQALVIDDDMASQNALVATLESWGIEALVAQPADVVDIVADGVINALIVDYDLGANSHDGLALLEACPDNQPSCRIIATANRDAALAERAKQLGARIIYKPIGSQALANALGVPTG